MTRSPFCLTSTAFLLAFASISFFSPASADIPSPSNAGQASGNNASPSSNVPFPGSQPPEILVGCSGLGRGGFQGCSKESIDLLKRSFQATLGSIETNKSSSLLFQVLSAPEPIDPSLLDPDSQALSSPFINTFQPRFNTNAVTFVLPNVANEPGASNLFAMQSLRLGLDPSSLKLGLALVQLGVPIQPCLQLVSALQGLATNPTYNAFSNSIRAFNVVVKDSPEPVRKLLNANADFIELSNSLRSIRSAVVVR